MDSSTGNKEILMKALAEKLPEDTIYSVCMIKHRPANRLLLVIRGNGASRRICVPTVLGLTPATIHLSMSERRNEPYGSCRRAGPSGS